MIKFEHPNPEVSVLVSQLRCVRCGTGPGSGLSATVEKLKPRQYVVRTRCLRCCGVGRAVLEVDALEPDDIDPRAMRGAEPVSSDELLEVISMPDTTFTNEWNKLVKS